MKNILSQREMDIINKVIKSKDLKPLLNSIQDFKNCTKDEIWLIIDGLTDLIGYDNNNHDIDSLGREADNIIEKLIEILRQRGEFY